MFQQALIYFFAAVAKLFVFTILAWMIGLVALLVNEMFAMRVLSIRSYLWDVWRIFWLCFEGVIYITAIVTPLLIWFSDSPGHSTLFYAAAVFSIIFLFIRIKIFN